MDMSNVVSPEFTEHIESAMLKVAVQAFNQAAVRESLPYWMKKKEAVQYANVDIKTLNGFIADGLKVSIKDGVQRISKKAVDEYYKNHEV